MAFASVLYSAYTKEQLQFKGRTRTAPLPAVVPAAAPRFVTYPGKVELGLLLPVDLLAVVDVGEIGLSTLTDVLPQFPVDVPCKLQLGVQFLVPVLEFFDPRQ